MMSRGKPARARPRSRGRAPEPTTTDFAILGLLAIRPFSTYELAKQFDRSLGRMWPRARSKLYDGPKRLVRLGWARASAARTGRRRRTDYAITAAGRRALARWLSEPGAGPELEYEQLLKVFFAEHGNRDSVAASLRAAREWALSELQIHAETGRAYLSGTGPFQSRNAHLVLTGRFLSELSLMVEAWASWALELVDGWPDDPSRAPVDTEALADVTRRLEERLAQAGRAPGA